MAGFRNRVMALFLLGALVLAAPAMAKVIKGTPGDDKLIGSKSADTLVGKAGHDILRSAEGPDLVKGNRGKDLIKAGKGSDEVHAGKGADEIHARDGKPDRIDCGPGDDVVFADLDETVVLDCEEVLVPKR